MAQIRCENVSFGYEGNPVVDGLDLSVEKGMYLCIVGENGAGKSTLIKGLLSLIAPLGGKLAFGEGLTARSIGYLPQQSAAQKDFPASVYEVVLSGCASERGFLPFYTKAQKQRVADMLELLQIADLKKRCYRELSGGQQQRVLLARALCATDGLLLLDEPVAGLDPLVTTHLYEVIERINRETGITIVMVSHDIQSAVKYASHILHLGAGQNFFGPVAEYRETAMCRAFMGGAEE